MRFYCQYVRHQELWGTPPWQVHVYDQFLERTTYRRVDGRQRLHERNTGREFCRRCIEHMVLETADLEQETLV